MAASMTFGGNGEACAKSMKSFGWHRRHRQLCIIGEEGEISLEYNIGEMA